MVLKPPIKPLVWMGSSRRDLKEFPDEVQDEMGRALFDVQAGDTPANAKPLKGFGGAVVLEIAEDFHRDTYRAVYTVKLEGAVYVLHCFQKKSKSGIATPKPDMDLIRARLKDAADLHSRKEGKGNA